MNYAKKFEIKLVNELWINNSLYYWRKLDTKAFELLENGVVKEFKNTDELERRIVKDNPFQD